MTPVFICVKARVLEFGSCKYTIRRKMIRLDEISSVLEGSEEDETTIKYTDGTEDVVENTFFQIKKLIWEEMSCHT